MLFTTNSAMHRWKEATTQLSPLYEVQYQKQEGMEIR
jgi:hypothetical protein